MKKASKFLTAFCVAVVLGGTAFGQTFSEAVDAYHRGDYETAARIFKPLAENGNTSAQFNLGLMYQNQLIKGEGFTRDGSDEAYHWYRRAAEQGNLRAQKLLGFYLYGEDQIEALTWLEAAANGGDPEAAFLLGEIYFAGWMAFDGDVLDSFLDGDIPAGIERDLPAAIRWYDLAAANGHPIGRDQAEYSRQVMNYRP